ncbi:hypothetical protein L1987_24827 [Smallanthus sonchifolius]|uniref:Uncharacterized protein n=1 Tax=Smallanthus sonchifolius TaxID=185202 RepID=A0ACB9ILQ2_9ASTR|nr:hypothetical protein L1987_24827 [Smallanthus sonchifolius]
MIETQPYISSLLRRKALKFITLMISLSDTPASTHKPQNPELDRKNSFLSLKHYLPRTWIIFTVFFLQILLLLAARNFHISTALTARHESPPISAVHAGNTECPSGKFASEIIYHNRMLNYRCRTLDAESATAYYIPFYAGLAVGKYLWTDSYTAKDRDRHCRMMLKWVHDQPYWKKSDGRDHFLTMGRITWDFRRSKTQDWGSGCIYLPGMRNITRLLIERNSWDYFDVGVPYPTGFHPTSPSDVATWQNFVRTRTRTTLFCFAGATRGLIKNDFRQLLLNQCYNSSGSCRVVDCGGSKCSNGTSLILESFLWSNFCLQPRGDSFTRRSIFDCMIAGSIPVFFWNRTAYSQYEWFLPGEPESYSVFIDKTEVLNGKSIKDVLEKFGKDEARKMREKVIEYIPRIVYAKPHEGLEGMKDAFDVAVEGVLNRVKDQEQEGYKW